MQTIQHKGDEGVIDIHRVLPFEAYNLIQNKTFNASRSSLLFAWMKKKKPSWSKRRRVKPHRAETAPRPSGTAWVNPSPLPSYGRGYRCDICGRDANAQSASTWCFWILKSTLIQTKGAKIIATTALRSCSRLEYRLTEIDVYVVTDFWTSCTMLCVFMKKTSRSDFLFSVAAWLSRILAIWHKNKV